MNHWLCLVVACTPDEIDAVSNVLSECGAGGMHIDDTEVLFDESEDATIVARERPQVRGYFDNNGGSPELLCEQIGAALLAAGVQAEAAVEALTEEDWSTSWRQNFPPLPIGPFLIVPTWEGDPLPAAEAIIIRLDPGLAFGTGQHPTTHLCLELLAEGIARWNAQHPGQAASLLDVGCGSGILSIAAAKLGARCTASDLDAFCTAATIENAAQNDVAVQVEQVAGVLWTEHQFDFVIANLMSDLLIRLAPDLRARTAAGGTLLVSGISSPRAAEVEAALHRAGFETTGARERDGDRRGDFTERWAAFVLRPV